MKESIKKNLEMVVTTILLCVFVNVFVFMLMYISKNVVPSEWLIGTYLVVNIVNAWVGYNTILTEWRD